MMGLPFMSTTFVIDPPISIDVRELHRVASSSVVMRLGVSIGEFGHSSMGPQPKYLSEGLEARLEYPSGLLNRWALSTSGEFYSEIGFFELENTGGRINGASRVLIVIDALEYASRLYSQLSMQGRARIACAFGFHNIGEFSLYIGDSLFWISSQRICIVNEVHFPSRGAYEVPLEVIGQNIAKLTKEILDSFFVLFDGLAVPLSTYESLVVFYKTGRLP
jgi:hypothetical protein